MMPPVRSSSARSGSMPASSMPGRSPCSYMESKSMSEPPAGSFFVPNGMSTKHTGRSSMISPSGWERHPNRQIGIPLACGWGISRELLLDLRQRVEHDVADNLQAARADVIEVVLRGMPLRIVQIDDVDRRDAGFDKRQVIVFDGEVLRDERRAVAETRG